MQAMRCNLYSSSTSSKPSKNTNLLGGELWIGLTDAYLGARIGDYFKFSGLSDLLHIGFLSLEELAARQLIRVHPPDLYADAFSQARIHVVVYSFVRRCTNA